MTKDDCASDVYMSRLLEYIFQSIVLVYGLDDVTNIKNVERMKKEIKVNTRVDKPAETSLSNTLDAIEI